MPTNQLSITGQTITQPVTITQSPNTNQISSNGETIDFSDTNSAANINSSQIIMNNYDSLEGFDQENTSQYSSFNPVQGLQNAATNTYDFINSYNPFPAINQYATNAYNTVKHVGDKSYNTVSNELSDVGSSTIDDINSASNQTINAIGKAGNTVGKAGNNTINKLKKIIGNAEHNIKKTNLNNYIGGNDSTEPTATANVPVQTVAVTTVNKPVNYNTILVLILLLAILIIYDYYYIRSI